MKRALIWILVATVPIVLLIESFVPWDAQANYESSIKIDPMSEVPEGLLFHAQKALAGFESETVWVPTHDFQSSSLVKVPRFPRLFTAAELKKNPSYSNITVEAIASSDTLKANAVINEVFSGQISVIAKRALKNLSITLTDLKSGDQTIPTSSMKARFVGYVPIVRAESEYDWSASVDDVIDRGYSASGTLAPDIVADPLYEIDSVDVPAYRNQPLWVTIQVPSNVNPGTFNSTIVLKAEGFRREIPVQLKVDELSIPDPVSYKFHNDLWFNPYALNKNTNTQYWTPEHWKQVDQYLDLLVKVGVKSVTTTITDDPWRVQWLNNTFRSQSYTPYKSMVEWHRDRDGKWNFDYSIFDQYVEKCFAAGIDERINTYSMAAFRGKERIMFFDHAANELQEKVFDSPADPEYQKIWKAFLGDFYAHLRGKGWEKKTYLCFDERPLEIMEEFNNFIKRDAPFFADRISIAGRPINHKLAPNHLSISYEFFPNQIQSSPEVQDIINQRNQNGMVTTFYLCGQPAHPNTLSFSPAVESRMIPWVALRYDLDGYVRWAFNNWPAKPFDYPVFQYIQGDEYMVYPGINGPISSIRYELFRDGVEDFELLTKYSPIVGPQIRSQVIELASRNEDGRVKDVRDMIQSRNLITEALQATKRKMDTIVKN